MKTFKALAESIKDAPLLPKNNFSGDWDYSKSLDLAKEVIFAGGVNVMRESEKGGSYYFHLKECIFDSSHANNDAAIQVRSNGSIGYHCFHDSCGNNTWANVRERLLPKEEYIPTHINPKSKSVSIPTKKESNKLVGSLAERIAKFYRTGLDSGYSTGWVGLDNYYTVLPGQWTLVTGIPSHGKSSWLDALMVNMAKLHGWKFAVFSPENHPLELHGSKLVEMIAGMSFFGTSSWARMPESEMMSCAEVIDNMFSFISHEDDILTLDGILDRAKTIMKKAKINGLVIDPWNEIDHDLKADTETLYISKALTKIRLFARNNNIHVWVVAHPTKMQKNDQGNYDPPTPYDVAGGAHWRNKADCSVTIHRPTFDPGDFRVDVHIQKVRFKHVGKVGKITFEYKLDCGQYKEAR